ncbi:host attachment protein [Aquicella lusitana]|uniref:Protein required for attachment to host cells n=1 Tax=Aquicella lusitana TaxID=254246 RepID=A0A370G7H7_9COXI|nr:host attachment protein [Aquicella lusitana]RDI37973.1 protein required for attachment to host cells [Aquicella lusitana]VVC74608.1 hypothetical protein AQULUS_23740 [Aquicella lusitana]
MNGRTWVLVADSTKARIYTTYKAKLFMPQANENDLKLLNEYKHPESRKHDSQLVSDNSGRYRATEFGSDTYDPPTDPKRYEEDRFAFQLSKVLHEAYLENEFEQLILIASPVFMGMLNKHISRANGLQKSVAITIEKDYTSLNERQLVKQLQEHL